MIDCVATSRRVRRQAPRSAWCVLGIVVLLAAASGGCQRTLFAGQTARTQYDQHDRLQDQHASDYEFDAFGQRHPNLRGRLLPRE